MKSRIETAMVLLCAGAALALQACGGGGGGGDGGTGNAGASPSTGGSGSSPGNSGSVSAMFKPKAGSARDQLIGVTSQRMGRLDRMEQAASGAVLKLDDAVLSGQTAVQDIRGDASFAMGRWVAGTLTTSSGSETLTGKDNRNYHYVVYNLPDAYPASASLSCDAGTFTAPSRDGGSSSGPLTGSTSGNASLSFAADGATVSGKLTVTAGSGSGSASLNTTGVKLGVTSITGGFIGGGGGAGVQVAEGADGTYQIVGAYRAKTGDGTGYIGVYRFSCK